MSNCDLKTLRILIVDDNRNFVSIVRDVLRGVGVRSVFACENGVSTLEFLKQTEVDLALIDLNLGDIDGLELTRLIRSAPDSQNPCMPIIMVTAHAERSTVQAAICAGVDEFLTKPLSPKKLLGRMVNLLENPLPYFRFGTYFGPDRRRSPNQPFKGTDRRMQQVKA